MKSLTSYFRPRLSQPGETSTPLLPNATIHGDTLLITTVSPTPEHNGVMVLVSDIDGDAHSTATSEGGWVLSGAVGERVDVDA